MQIFDSCSDEKRCVIRILSEQSAQNLHWPHGLYDMAYFGGIFWSGYDIRVNLSNLPGKTGF